MSSLVLPSGLEIQLKPGSYRLARDPEDNNIYLYYINDSVEEIPLACEKLESYVQAYSPKENKFGSLLLEVDGTTYAYMAMSQKFPFVILPNFIQKCEGLSEEEIHYLAFKNSRDIYRVKAMPREDGYLVCPIEIIKEIFGHYVLAGHEEIEGEERLSLFLGEFFEKQSFLSSFMRRSENNLLHDGDGIAVCGGPLFAFYKNEISYEDIVRACKKKEIIGSVP